MSTLRTVGLAVLTSLCLFACSSSSSSSGAPDNASEEDDISAQSTTLTFPLIVHEYKGHGEYVTLPLESLNAELQRAGMEPFGTSITVGRTAEDRAAFEAIVARVEAVADKLGRNIEFLQDWNPGEYIGLCHTGSVAGVRKTVEALRGVAFSEYMGMSGYRYKTTKKFLYDIPEAEFLDIQRETGNEEKVKIWTDFDTSSDAFLMMTDGGQEGDGTELFAVTIPKCK